MISRKPHVIGKPFPLIEAQRKLTGVSCYAGDETITPDMLHARILFSERPKARIKLRNLNAARKHPGVVALITAKDVNGRLGHTIGDRELLASGQVDYVGQPLAIVAACSLIVVSLIVVVIIISTSAAPKQLQEVARRETNKTLEPGGQPVN